MAFIHFNERDRDRILEFLQWYRTNRYRRRPDINRADLLQPNDVYIAYPNASIPALSGATPGTAQCTVYSVLPSGVLQELGKEYTVYNLHTTSISQQWVAIDRTKFGTWIVDCPCGLAASPSPPPPSPSPSISPSPSVDTGICSQNALFCSFGTYECWEVAVAGVTDDGCTDCDDYNGTYVVRNSTNTTFQCFFTNNPQKTGGCTDDGDITVTLGVQSTGPKSVCGTTSVPTAFWWIQCEAKSFSGGAAAYRENGTYPFDCDTPSGNELDFLCVTSQSASECATWPSTLTAVPIICP